MFAHVTTDIHDEFYRMKAGNYARVRIQESLN
jgi:hypothetical protein